MNRPCTLLQRSEGETEDDYGNPIPVETAVETVCEIQQQQRFEREDADELAESRWLLILPIEQSVNTGDAVVVDGETYELVGDPWRVRNPRTGIHSHIEATVRRTSGPGDEVGS